MSGTKFVCVSIIDHFKRGYLEIVVYGEYLRKIFLFYSKEILFFLFFLRRKPEGFMRIVFISRPCSFQRLFDRICRSLRYLV